jgi:predicted RNase H-like HicB family nuclease
MSKAFQVIREGIVLHVRPEPEGGYTIMVPALPGCLTYGETFEDALARIDDAIAGWLVVAREDGLPIPEEFESLPRAS